MASRKDLINEWITKAEHDLGMAELAIKHKDEYTDAICFHAQQTVEKYLKAYMIYLELDPPKTHNLSFLLDLISDKAKISQELYEEAENLDEYSVEIRYPVENYYPSKEEAVESIVIAKKFRAYICQQLK